MKGVSLLLRSLNKRHWTIIIVSIFMLLIAVFILPISLPLLFAFLTALSLNPLVRSFEIKLKFNRKFSVIAVYIIFILLLTVIGTYAITNIIKQLVDLAENIPDYIVQMNNLLINWGNELELGMKDLPAEFVSAVNQSIRTSVNSLTNILMTNVRVENLATIVAVIPNYIVSFIVYLIALFMFMLELPILKTKFYQNFTERTAEKIQFMNARLKHVFVGFMKAQFLVSLIILATSLLGLFIIIPEYAIIMATIIWIIDLIPIIGSIAILGPWAAYMLLTGNTVMGIQLAFLAIILLAIRRTVEPKVMGQQIGLSPLATLIAMYLGLKFFGFIGFLLGPLIVIAFTSAREAGIIRWKVKI